MIVAHHGFGEESLLVAVIAAGGVGSGLLAFWRLGISALVRWLRRP